MNLKKILTILLMVTTCRVSCATPQAGSANSSDSSRASTSPALGASLIQVNTSDATTSVCASEPFSAITSNQGIINFPTSGRFVLESHLATTSDEFLGARLFPNSSSENIQSHLDSSCQELKRIRSGIECAAVYKTKYHKEWTPPENGEAGQGSGNTKPSLREEMFSGNMMWKAGKKPQSGTKFLATYNGKSVVFVMGYETGPSDKKWLGGLQGEVFYFLGANDTAHVTVTKLKNQKVLPGPIQCN